MTKWFKTGPKKNTPKIRKMTLPGPIFGVPGRVKLGPEASRERPKPVQKKRSFLIVFRDPQKTEK